MWKFECHGNRVAICSDEGITIRYSDLHDDCSSVAHLIHTKSLILNICTSSVGAVAGYSCFLESGNTCFMVEAERFYTNPDYFIKYWEPDYLWLPDNSPIKLDYPVVWAKYGFSLLKTRFKSFYAINKDLALLLSTSGTTNSAKLIRLSFSNLASNTSSILGILKLDHTDRSISALPLHYTYGLSVINTHLKAGASVFMTEKKMVQSEFWERVRNHSITNINGVPYHYELMHRLKILDYEWPDLRFFTQAGGKLPEHLQEYFAKKLEEKGKGFFIMYGQTEATARISYLPPEKAQLKKGSVGIAVPGTVIQLWDQDNTPINGPYKLGEIVVEGENVFMGYAASKDDLKKGNENGKILHTCDLGWFDEEGFLYIQGRKSRLVKVFGERVNLDEMEHLLKSAFNGIQVACTENENKVIIYYSGAIASEELLSKVCRLTRLHFSAFTCIRKDNLPVNLSGKIEYKKL